MKPRIHAMKGLWVCRRRVGLAEFVGVGLTVAEAFSAAHPAVLPPNPYESSAA